jgi:hypothetical protein
MRLHLVRRMPQEAGSMSRFVIRFMKDVLGENGRQVEICQSIVEVDASSEGHATELAKQKFCETQSLCDWSLHADRLHIEKADFPS